MKYIKTFESYKIPIFDEKAKSLAPKSLDIITYTGHYKMELTDFYVAGNSHLINMVYHHNTVEETGTVTADGEPDYLCFDIRFTRNEQGMNILCDITYGDNMESEFKITPNSKVIIGHYNGIGSVADPDTSFAFTDESLEEIVKFFNRFGNGINLTVKDFHFLDNDKNSYKYPNKGKSMPVLGSLKLTPLPLGDKILLIDNCRQKDELYTKNITTYLDLRGIDYIVAGDLNDLKRMGNEKIVGIISSGSNYHLSESECEEKIKLNSRCMSLYKVPFLGICFGMQVLSKLYNTDVIEGGKEVYDKKKLDEYDQNSVIFKSCDLDKLQVSFDYKDILSGCPKNFKIIAKSGETICGIENGDKFGVLFHPEDIPSNHIILDNFIEICSSAMNHSDFVSSGKFESIKRFK
jgi:anthranilate/para-aminobenzoate synthase component II